MSDDLKKRLQDYASGEYDMTPICSTLLDAKVYIEELEWERDGYKDAAKTWQEDFIQENNRWVDALRKLAKAVDALRFYAVFYKDPFGTRARIVLADLEKTE